MSCIFQPAFWALAIGARKTDTLNLLSREKAMFENRLQYVEVSLREWLAEWREFQIIYQFLPLVCYLHSFMYPR
jgi:hypothetical protein